MAFSANSYSQNTKLTLELNNITVKEALKTIEKQSQFLFFYQEKHVDLDRLVSVHVTNQNIESVLNKLFAGTENIYVINDRQIVIGIAPRKELVRQIQSISGGAKLIVEQPQITEVTGKVTDKNNLPLPGVSIIVKGTVIGTVTNAEGEFSLSIPLDAEILQFSFVGMSTHEVPIVGRTVFNVMMQEETIGLEEVVAVGYGTQKKVNLTGAISTVGESQLVSGIDANIASRLQGQAAGVTVLRDNSPGGDASIRVRGFGSINNNDPLYVIDGVPVTGGLNKINANDIESMTVLKDAAAAAIYGSRSSNGVIIITTKQGAKGEPQVSLQSKFGIQQTKSQMDLLNAKEYAELKWLEARNLGLKPGDTGWGSVQYGYGDEPVIPDYILPAGKMIGEVDESAYSYPDPYNGITKANKIGTNWYKEMFQISPIQEHNISIRGGGNKNTYAFSAGYIGQEGILKFTDFNRFSIRANENFEINDWFLVGHSIGITNSNRVGAGYNTEGGAIAQAYRAQSIIPIYDIMGNFAGSKAPTMGNSSNPVAELYRARNNNNNETRVIGNTFAQFNFGYGITFKSLIGIDLNKNRFTNYSLKNTEMSEARVVDSLTEGYSGGYQYNWSNTLNYLISIANKHNVNVLIGTEAIEYNWDTLGGSKSTFAFTDLDYMILNAGETSPANSGTRDKWATLSYFGRLNYNYLTKYFVEVVFRRDGSSRFSSNNRWGSFPAISAGWMISEEDFLQDLEWLNGLKVRGGIGINGNDNVGNYNIYSTFRATPSASYYDISGSSNTTSKAGFHKYKLGNPDAKWESTISKNLGFDINLINNKFIINIDVFSKLTKDMLYPDSRPATWGRVQLPSINVGEMKNSGWEFMIQYNDKIGSDFRFTIQPNLSHYKNKVIALNDNVNEILYGNMIRNEVFTATKAGYPVSSFYGYVVEGIFNSQQEVDIWPKYEPDAEGNDTYSSPGVLKYKDINGDGVITADDRTFIGNPHPKLSYGLNLEFYYKNFDVTAFFHAITGNSVINYGKRVTDFNHFSNNRSYARLYESWTPERFADGDFISLPIALTDNRDVIMQKASSFFVEDGSFFRMKDLQIGYSLPETFLTKIKLNYLRVFFQANNLFTITKYSGLDPEFKQSTDREIGVDIGIYPSAQTFQLGINIGI